MRIEATGVGVERLAVGGSGPAAVPNDGDFGQMLTDVLKEVNGAQQKFGQAQNAFATNQQPVEYHDLMIAEEKASIAMQLTLQVRNKLLEAYQEISRMQV